MPIGAFDIGDKDGFATDQFGRAPFADKILNQLAEHSDGTTMALDAPWGAGKSVFLKQMVGHANSKGWKVVYYDAFASDYSDDAFIPLVAEIVEAFPANTKTVVAAKATTVAKRLLSTGLRVGTKWVMRDALDEVDWTAMREEDLAAETDRVTAQIADQIEGAAARKAEIKDFANAINAQVDGADAGVLIIIDELDRCRPEFAVQTLERVKHLFADARCSFLFGVNQSELAAIVKGFYGDGFSGRKYLQRFFEYEVGFPKLRNESPAARHLNGLRNESPEDNQGLALYVANILESGHLNFMPSLRDVERILAMSRQGVLGGMSTDEEYTLMSLLAIVSVCRPDAFLRLVARPPSVRIWQKLFDFDALTGDLPQLASLLEAEEKNGTMELNVDGMDDVFRSFRLARSRIPSQSYPGIIQKYADTYLKGLA